MSAALAANRDKPQRTREAREGRVVACARGSPRSSRGGLGARSSRWPAVRAGQCESFPVPLETSSVVR